ncbi:hypothetical protein JB92DRAFT_2904692 [Gautieria morchelliformis]|nr:hypothetical protein JB92DRAFT_2904692 [Gautieria morchelliformis]
MAQFQDLTRVLLSAGGAPHPEGKGSYLLYTDQSSLTSKHWTGNTFGDQELVAKSVRANSPAAYLLAPTTRLIICISSSSTLRALRYDDDDEEWVDDKTILHIDVHPEGKLSASLDRNEDVRVVYQDPMGNLVFLNNWTPTVLPADPIAGSPLSTVVDGDKLHVFYISAKDNCIHYVTRAPEGSWSGNVMVNCPVEEKIKRFIVAPIGDTINFDAYLLTADDMLLQVTPEGDGVKRELGKIDSKGIFVPGTSAQCCPFVWVTFVCWQPVPMRCCCW